MLIVLFGAITLVMLLLLACVARGPGLFNHLLAINSFGTLTVLLLVLFSALFNQHSLMDIALLYALVNFIGPLVVLRFFSGHKLPEEKVRSDDVYDRPNN